MSNGRVFYGRSGWCVRSWLRTPSGFTLEHTWTSSGETGRIIGDLICEHNSVGAFTGGTLTFDGYLNWPPRSRMVEVFLGQVPSLGQRIGLGIAGLIRATRSPTGQRTTTLPLLGLHTRDENGLVSLGMATAFMPFVSAGLDLYGVTLPPAIYGQKVGERLAAAFGNNLTGSWGVRPDGTRVAGLPASFDPLPLSAAAAGFAYSDSGYEEPAFTNEYEVRPAERWQSFTGNRGADIMVPRRGVAVTSGDTLQDSSGSAPGSISQGGTAESGYIIGTVDLRGLVVASAANAEAVNVSYDPQGLAFDVQISNPLDALPDDPPEDWGGPFGGPLPTWYPVVPVRHTLSDTEIDQYIDTSATFAGMTAEGRTQLKTYIRDPAKGDRARIEAFYWNDQERVVPERKLRRKVDWDNYRNSRTINLSWGEWLSTSTAESGIVTGSTPIGINPKPQRRTVNPEADEGILRRLYTQTASLNTEGRRIFQWRFAAPEALVRQIDPALGPAYNWCFAAAWYGESALVAAETSHNAGTLYAKRNTGTFSPSSIEGYGLPYLSPPTFQGEADNAAFYGPVTLSDLVDSYGTSYTQDVTNSRIILGIDSLRTEWQSGARQ